MKNLLKLFFLLLVCTASIPAAAAQVEDKLLDVMKQEFVAQWEELRTKPQPPYYMNYRVVDASTSTVTASFGALTSKNAIRNRSFVPQLRLGSPALDNFTYMDMGGMSAVRLPIDDERAEAAARMAMWKEVNARYALAIDVFEQSATYSQTVVEQDDKAPNFSDTAVETYYEAPFATPSFTLDEWAARVKAVSATFKSDPAIVRGDVYFTYKLERRYFIDSDGREVVQNLPYAQIMVFGQTRADDGMQLPMELSYFAYDPADLPSDEMIIADIREMISTLAALRTAPVAEPYTGPALLSGLASGVFFHEIFGHRVEGQRMKRGSDGQTFKKMVGADILPAELSVYDDPTLRSYAGTDLNGYYKFDDQGVRAQRVEVVRNGKLNDFLMTRTPINNHFESNGHARASDGFDPVSRQSNLIIETASPYTTEQLREMLIDAIKKQGKEYGYYFAQVTSGFTFTGKEGVNSFNVTPLVVYKVFADERPDQLVRGVDLIGTPLSMFSNIASAGNDPAVFTGMCGAESGSIPVTAISPTIFVTKVETQLKAKSDDTPPVLTNPGSDTFSGKTADETIFRAMQDEMQRSAKDLALPGYDKPFYISYSLGQSEMFSTTGMLGAILNSNYSPAQALSTMKVFTGDYRHTSDVNYSGNGPRIGGMPVEADYGLIRRNLWMATDVIYKGALMEMAAKEAALKSNPLHEDEAALDDLIPVAPVERTIPGGETGYDRAALEDMVRRLSAVFLDYPEILESQVTFSGFSMDVYKTTTEGVKLKMPVSAASLRVTASVRTPDGSNIDDAFQSIVPIVSDLASAEELEKDIRNFAERLITLRNTPLIDEYYSGPVLFEDGAAMGLFSRTLLKQGEGLIAQRTPVGRPNVRTLASRLGRRVIDSRLTVKNLTRLAKFEGKTLYGAYEIDAEGVVPPEEITLIEKGILKGFLNGRIPAVGATETTGSSRFAMTNSEIGYSTAPGTIMITAERGLEPEELKKALLAAAADEGLDYAYIVRRSSGRASMVYKVDVADGAETLVRFAEISPVTLSDMERIREISAKQNVSNYVDGKSIMSSMIYPSGLILDNIEVLRPRLQPDKEPVLTHPAKRNK